MGKEYEFINPYNFIPLSKVKKPIRKPLEKGNLTGYIECNLETLTPLIMIDSNSLQESNFHRIYNDTFKINGVPAIPGSELRGMVRSKFEELTNSCFSNAEEELQFFGRHGGQNMNNPGLLDLSDPDYPILWECKKYEANECKEIKSYKSGDVVKFTVRMEYRENGKKSEVVDRITSDGKREGIVKKGEKFNHDNHYHIFEKVKRVEGLINQDDLKDNYDRIVEIYHDNLAKSKDPIKASKPIHESETDTDLKPVWYEVDNHYVYFSLGQNGQTINRNVFKDLIDDVFLPCNDEENLCETCRLFGTVQDNFAVASRVRFSDALIQERRGWEYSKNPIPIAELSGPKYSNAYFYMELYKNDDIVEKCKYAWNSDFLSIFGGDDPEENITIGEEYVSKDGNSYTFTINIRGRKAYWHHSHKINRDEERTKRNNTVLPVRKGVNYKFKVHFDNLTQDELDKLSMALCLNNDSTYAHKLGLGKPLGFGSVKVKVESINIREVSYDEGITFKVTKKPMKKDDLFDVFTNLDEFQKDAIEKIYNFDWIKEKKIVDYPRNVDKNQKNSEIYRWFASNKDNKVNKGPKTLPFSYFEYDDIIQYGFDEKKKQNKKSNYQGKQGYKGKRY